VRLAVVLEGKGAVRVRWLRGLLLEMLFFVV